jgi:predicted regulator of Ras-like GTPase activity (Roadblock/LC7/MglB family)
VDVAEALSDLTEISSQIRAAAIVDADGTMLGATGGGDALADVGRKLVDEAQRVRGGAAPTQLEVATHAGSVFVLRDGERTIVATTGPEPTVGLVFYDLKSCLKAIDAKPKPKPKPRARKKPATTTTPKKKKKDANGAS